MSVRELKKTVQRGCYTLLNSRLGAFMLFVSAVVIINTGLKTVDDLLGTTFMCDVNHVNDYTDNIGGSSFESVLCTEPIDAVYTWVNGSEDFQQAEIAFWQMRQAIEDLTSARTQASPAANASDEELNSTEAPPRIGAQQLDDQSSRNRFEDHEELRFSLRGLEKYAGWIRHVYIVTNGQVPTWLDINNPRVTIVPHSSIFFSSTHLPTFSSSAIEANIHRIPGLSRRFIYLNDDTFFGAPVIPDDFSSPTKGHRLFYSWPVPACADGCPAAWLGDGTCDKQCNTTDCDYDAGDCVGPNVKTMNMGGGHSGRVGGAAKASNCHGMCSDGWIGDKYCDVSCNTAQCGYDATDCGLDSFMTDHGFTVRTLSPHGDNIPRVSHHSFNVLVTANAFLINLSSVFPIGKGKITAGDHDQNSWVRTATISQVHKILVVTIVSIVEEAVAGRRTYRCQFVVSGEVDAPADAALDEKASKVVIHRKAYINVTLVQSGAPARLNTSRLHKIVSPAPTASNNLLDIVLMDKPMGKRAADWIKQKRMNDARNAEQGAEEGGAATRVLMSLGKSVEGVANVEEESRTTQRRLQDMFGDSLKFTNMLVSKKFRSVPRKVPAHMAHMIYTDVIGAVWETWPKEMEATSASKFRSKTNLQFAFLHYYYMVSAKAAVSIGEIFDTMLDMNVNGVLDRHERRRVSLLLWEKNVALDTLETLCKLVFTNRDAANRTDGWETTHPRAEAAAEPHLLITPAPPIPTTAEPTTMAPIPILRNATAHQHAGSGGLPASPAPIAGGRTNSPVYKVPVMNPDDNIKPMPVRYFALSEWLIDAAARGWSVEGAAHDIKPHTTGMLTRLHFVQSHLGKLLLADYGQRDAFKTTVEELDDVTFIMVRNNVTVVQHQMDHVLFKRPKFLCINDDMNHSHPEHGAVLAAVHNLLHSYFPTASSFELPADGRNSFTRLTTDEIAEHESSSGVGASLLFDGLDAKRTLLRTRGNKRLAQITASSTVSRVAVVLAGVLLVVVLCLKRLATK